MCGVNALSHRGRLQAGDLAAASACTVKVKRRVFGVVQQPVRQAEHPHAG
jgi:hypothetical protein